MGPVTLFDKSFLQSLSIDESVWFDHYFYSAICPIFYVETLADLAKATKKRSPEQEVGIIADKFPEMHGTPTANHREMAIDNLLGNNVSLSGQIPMAGGRIVNSEGRKGVVYDQTPEAEAFLRWQNREFAEVEKMFAKQWRANLKNQDQNAILTTLTKIGISGTNCKSLEEAKAIADSLVDKADKPFDKIKLAITSLNIPAHLHKPIIERWSKHNYPPLSKYAPYAAHVLTVDIFYQIALQASLESSQRPSNLTDIAYLYYLPFCMVFISCDKLHKRCCKLFLRDNQDFAEGSVIKGDLANINQHFSSLTDAEKSAGIGVFAAYPPTKFNCKLNELWDKHIHAWREKQKEPYKIPDQNPELIEKLNKFSEAPAIESDEINLNTNDSELISLTRMVSKRKGSWWQLPKDLEEN